MSKHQDIYEFRVVDRVDIKPFIENNHYSRSINGCKTSICFAIYESNNLVGCALFGELSTTSWKKYAYNEKDVVELRRFVTLDTCVKNTESFFISKCLRYIKKNLGYKICISYADPYFGHIGYLYQATNWSYQGTTNKDVVMETQTGKRYHSRAMRTKYNGQLKPFAKRLQEDYNLGLLKEIEIPGKHIYIYNLRGAQKANYEDYPKGDVLTE